MPMQEESSERLKPPKARSRVQFNHQGGEGHAEDEAEAGGHAEPEVESTGTMQRAAGLLPEEREAGQRLVQGSKDGAGAAASAADAMGGTCPEGGTWRADLFESAAEQQHPAARASDGDPSAALEHGLTAEEAAAFGSYHGAGHAPEQQRQLQQHQHQPLQMRRSIPGTSRLQVSSSAASMQLPQQHSEPGASAASSSKRRQQHQQHQQHLSVSYAVLSPGKAMEGSSRGDPAALIANQPSALK